MNGDISRGGRDEFVGAGGTARIGMPVDPDVAGAGTGAGAGVAHVSGAVSEWVEQVGRFLGVLQAALEQSRPREDATAEVRALSGQLPALIRQCRAQVPTPDMIRTWVKTVSEHPAGEATAGAPAARSGQAAVADCPTGI